MKIDFFVEPTKGLFEGPFEFVEGVEKGTSSLLSKTAYGVFDITSKISETFGKGRLFFSFSQFHFVTEF